MLSIVVGLQLMVFGVVYLRWPEIYRHGFWRETDILQRLLTREQYRAYMQTLGMVLVAIGAVLVLV
jgi:hypothetical protein